MNNGRPIVVAAGGGLGEPVNHWRQRWPNALFALFEPAPSYFAELERRFGADPRVLLSSEALSDRIGQATFYLSHIPQTSSLLPFNTDCPAYFPLWATETTITVQTITLDEWARWLGVERIALLELDVQGGELAALRGAEGLLRAGAIDELLVEAFHTDLYQGVPLPDEIRDYMARLGYRVVAETSQEGSQFTDIQFVRGQA